MSNTEGILETLYPYRPLVTDMTEDMLSGISEYHPGRLGRVANVSGQYIASSATNICWQLEKFFEDVEGLDVPQLFEQDQRQLIEERVSRAAVETGKMTLAYMVTIVNMKPHFYSYGNHRFGIINPDDGERLAPCDWVERYWAPDYAKRFAEATIIGLKKED